MKKPFLREYSLELGLIFFLLSIVLFIVSVIAIWFLNLTPKFLRAGFELFVVSGWAGWGIFFGALIALISGWIFIDTSLKLHEFRKLVNENSRAKFIKNLERLEYLAWRLSSKQEEELLRHKKRLNIKL